MAGGHSFWPPRVGVAVNGSVSLTILMTEPNTVTNEQSQSSSLQGYSAAHHLLDEGPAAARS